ncbi:MAG: TonB-dependent receptor [Deltaproteobacteria bacterium]|nr:TonB-dependent receptor [Deltaproteobacteria bacterium]
MAQVYAFQIYHSDGWRSNDKADKKNFSGRWTYKFSDQFQASLNLRAYNGNWEAPGNISHLRRNKTDHVDDGSGEGGGGFRDRYDGRLWANYFINDESQLTFYLYGTSMETTRHEVNDVASWPVTGNEFGGGEDYSRHKSWGTGLTYNFKGDINGKAATATVGFTYSYELEDPRVFYNYVQGGGRRRGSIGRYAEQLSINNPAILAEVSYQVHEMFNIRLGSRYDWIYGKYRDLRPTSANFNQEIESDTYGIASPKVGVLFTPTDRLSFYANFGRGFSLPSMSGGADGFYANNSFALKVRDQYEIGSRATVTDWLDLELALFKVNTKNDTSYDYDTNRTVAAGTTERHGLEFSALFKPSADWSINTNYSFTRGKYKSFTDTSNNKLDGYKMTNIPAHMLNFELMIHPENYPFGARITYHGEYDRYSRNMPSQRLNGQLNQVPKQKAPNFEIVDVMLYYKINDNYRILFNVNNLFDKEYYTGLSHGLPDPNTGDWVGQRRPPRTFYLTLEMNWDKKEL